ncbi:MAG: polysaccharide biosynthesis protein, partial [Desulfocucumaceae bacterium]
MWAKWRVISLIIIDVVLINMGLLIAFYLRFSDSAVRAGYIKASVSIFILSTFIYLLSFFIFRLYNRVWSYASTSELLAVISSVSVGALGTIASSFFMRALLPRSIIIMAWAFTIILVGGSRFAWRLLVEKKKGNGTKPGRKAIIVGAGDAGAMVARELCNNGHIDLRPVGFIDDDPSKQKLSLLGIPVLGGQDDIPAVVSKYNVDEIIIAMPSVDGQAVRKIADICRSTNANIKVLPGVYEIIDGRVSIDRLRPLQLEDLLHREPVNINLAGISGYLKDRVVLVTGA